MLRPLALTALFVSVLSPIAAARPVDESGRLEHLGLLSGGRGSAGALAGVFGAAQAETTYYGGTAWAADSARWEALEDSVWTFDSGVGSHFDHSAPGVDPNKDPSLHAAMEGWLGWDNSYSEITHFRRLGVSDPRWGPDVCVASAAGIPPAPGETTNQASFWCGVFPEEADQFCYVSGQGYGNSWNVCIRKPFPYAGGGVTLDFDFVNESEPGFDFSQVVVDTGGVGNQGDEVVVTEYDGPLSGHESLALSPGLELPSTGGGSVYLKFCFTSDGAWSDEDGLSPTTCGAFALDNIQLGGGIADGPATFESGDDGWELAPAQPGFGGEWSNLVHLADLPPTATPCSCTLQDSVLVFDDLDLGGGHNNFCDNLAASPWIDLGPDGYDNRAPGKVLETNLYGELPLLNYIFIQFNVQWYPETCEATGKLVTSPWTSNGFVFFLGGVPICPGPGDPPLRTDFSAFIPSGAEQVRVAVGVISYCRFFAECTGVSNSTPWFDDVRLGVFGNPAAPLIAARTIDLPQDSFPQDGTLRWDSPGRIDSNNVLGAASPEVGTALADTLLVQGGSGNAEVFVQFSMVPGSGVDSTDFADYLATLTFEETRNGRDWYSAQMDTAELGLSGPVIGSWMTARIEGSPGFTGSDTDTDLDDFDSFYRDGHLLNDIFPDDLLTPGSHLDLFYKTRFVGGTAWYILPDTTGGIYFDMDVLPSSFSEAMEFNCVLYVDHFDGLGAEPIIADALRSILGSGGGGTFEGDYFDTYNVRAPSSQQASLGRPGYAPGQVRPTPYGAEWDQLIGYNAILWSSGNLPSFNLTREDGDVLIPYLTLVDFGFRHLYLTGDNLVESAINQAASEPSARRLVEDLAGATLLCRTFRDLDCPPGTPEDLTACVNLDPVSGAPVAESLGRTMPHVGQGNGCPERRSFDVLGVNPSPDFGVPAGDEIHATGISTSGPDGFASVANDAADSGSLNYRIVTDGVSVHYRRSPGDCTYGGSAASVAERLAEVLTYLGYAEPELCFEPVGDGTPPPPPPPAFVTALANFSPNPFQPGAPGRIRFSMEREAPARVDVFDLNGRLVRTVIDGPARAGWNEVVWDGSDGFGRLVAGGVYFYRLRALGREFTSKVVVIRGR